MWQRVWTVIWTIVTAAVLWWIVLVCLAQYGMLFDGYLGPLAILLVITAPIAFFAYRISAPGKPAPVRRPSGVRAVHWAWLSTVVAASPLLGSLASMLIAALLGCSVNEHYARGCMVGTWDLSPIVHELHLFIFALMFTWPAALIALGLWAKVLVDRAN